MTWRSCTICARKSPCCGRDGSSNRGRPRSCSAPPNIRTRRPWWRPCRRPNPPGARRRRCICKSPLPRHLNLRDDANHAHAEERFVVATLILSLEFRIMLKRRAVLTTAALAAVPLALPQAAFAQGRKDSIVLAMALEPVGLDPTAAAASSIAEVTQYNIYETLTKINSDGSVTPLLAEGWEVSPDLRTYTF